MCLMACRVEYKMDYSSSLLNNLSRSTQNLIQSSSCHDAYDAFHSTLHSSSSPFSAVHSPSVYTNNLNSSNLNQQRFRSADSQSAQSLTQSICQSLSQSSGLVVRLARLALDLYYCTMDLPFLFQLFTFGINQIDLNLNRLPNHQSEGEERNDSDRCAEVKPQVERISFIADKPNDSLPDIIMSHQKDQKLKQDLIDIGRKLRYVAEQFEKQRSVK